MSFKDIIKSSLLEGYAGNEITTLTIIVALLIASAFALYIFLVYRVMTRKTFYSKSFSISLAGVTLITTAIILTMQSSFVLSLGMVGALSIVRFRTAIKDPIDLMFLFWAISTGIICGAGLSQVAIVLALILTVGMLVLEKLPVAKAPMILVINASDVDIESTITETIKHHTNHFTVKSRNLTDSTMDLVVELRTSSGNDLVKEIIKLEGVTSASLLSHDGEVTF